MDRNGVLLGAVMIFMLVLVYLVILYNTIPEYVFLGNFVIYFSCAWVILPLHLKYICIYINLSVNIIPVSALTHFKYTHYTHWLYFILKVLSYISSLHGLLCHCVDFKSAFVLICLCILYLFYEICLCNLYNLLLGWNTS